MNIKLKLALFASFAVLMIMLVTWHAAYLIDHDRDEQPIQNCPHGHVCRWEAIDTSTGACVKNCDVRP